MLMDKRPPAPYMSSQTYAPQYQNFPGTAMTPTNFFNATRNDTHQQQHQQGRMDDAVRLRNPASASGDGAQMPRGRSSPHVGAGEQHHAFGQPTPASFVHEQFRHQHPYVVHHGDMTGRPAPGAYPMVPGRMLPSMQFNGYPYAAHFAGVQHLQPNVLHGTIPPYHQNAPGVYEFHSRIPTPPNMALSGYRPVHPRPDTFNATSGTQSIIRSETSASTNVSPPTQGPVRRVEKAQNPTRKDSPGESPLKRATLKSKKISNFVRSKPASSAPAQPLPGAFVAEDSTKEAGADPEAAPGTNSSALRPMKSKSSTSQFRGVYYNKHAKLWRARIWANGYSENLGSYESELEAALAFDKRAKELRGPMALINFPENVVPTSGAGTDAAIENGASGRDGVVREESEAGSARQAKRERDEDTSSLSNGASIGSGGDASAPAPTADAHAGEIAADPVVATKDEADPGKQVPVEDR